MALHCEPAHPVPLQTQQETCTTCPLYCLSMCLSRSNWRLAYLPTAALRAPRHIHRAEKHEYHDVGEAHDKDAHGGVVGMPAGGEVSGEEGVREEVDDGNTRLDISLTPSRSM